MFFASLRKIFGLTEPGPAPRPDTGLAELEARIQTLERRWKEVDVEWSGWYDKYRRLYARLAKRESRDREGEDEPEAGPLTPYQRIRGGGPVNPLAERMLNRGVLSRGR